MLFQTYSDTQHIACLQPFHSACSPAKQALNNSISIHKHTLNQTCNILFHLILPSVPSSITLRHISIFAFLPEGFLKKRQARKQVTSVFHLLRATRLPYLVKITKKYIRFQETAVRASQLYTLLKVIVKLEKYLFLLLCSL